MRNSLLLAVLCSTSAMPLAAQLVDRRPAFPLSVTASVGFTGFADRMTLAATSAGYGSSIDLNALLDVPLTRRLGIMAEGTLAPVAKQRTSSDVAQTYDNVTAARVDVGLAFRFKPRAPVFFAVGGGLFYAKEYAYPQTAGSVSEPEGYFRVGYDGPQRGNLALRASIGGHLLKPKVPAAPENLKAKSLAFDYDFHVGVRYVFERRPAARPENR